MQVKTFYVKRGENLLDQYISDRLKKNEEELLQLSEKLNSLQKEEEHCSDMIQKLVEQEDVGIEFFSPRNSNDTTRKKVSEIKKQIDNIHIQQSKTSEDMAQKKIENAKYQEMLEEIRNRDQEYQTKQAALDASVVINSGFGEEQYKEELKKILSRIDKCLNLLNMNTNKNQCKNELMNLKYYLKALISNKN